MLAGEKLVRGQEAVLRCCAGCGSHLGHSFPSTAAPHEDALPAPSPAAPRRQEGSWGTWGAGREHVQGGWWVRHGYRPNSQLAVTPQQCKMGKQAEKTCGSCKDREISHHHGQSKLNLGKITIIYH